MQHDIPSQRLGPLGEGMAQAVESCVHCGFCLAACPTYRLTGEETQSPRGRIILMKEVLEGGLEAEAARPYLDSCLGCLACEPACPSGVSYRELLQPYRQRQWEDRSEGRSAWQRLRKSLLHRTLPYPRRFRLALRLARWVAPLRRLLPSSLRTMVELTDVGGVPDSSPLPHVCPAKGPRRARVKLLAGCAQQVIAPQILTAAVRVLTRQGVECVLPEEDTCCGALAFHDGQWDVARALAGRQLESMPEDVDAVVSLAAGCGSAMKEYPMLWAGQEEAENAQRWAHKVCDVTELLVDLGIVARLSLPQPKVVAYQDACHLAQAQGLRGAPRQLLQGVEGLTLVTPDEPDMCCGSAGTYNLEHPEMARRLAERKVDHLLATGADWIASGNIGCIVQMRSELARRPTDGSAEHGSGEQVSVLHTVEILAQASASPDPA